ncbi:hypothetical protein ACN28C_19405 [Plantactinospora sp. WMMC1484]|uniref:hypothetical protein n=1 Tax=Plantactinospora sp. WMMC1484 TaxID=3404122 RepID=UPI003BF5AD8C
MTVAVLGATGSVGRLVVEALNMLDVGPVRAGMRATVDAADRDSLARFVEGAAVLVNCLGPGYRLRGRVVAVADRQGCAYVDPSGDDALHARLLRESVRVPVVTGAGSVPGGLGLLVRWLARGRGAGDRIRGYVLTDEPIHSGTALEFLLGARAGQGVGPPASVQLPSVEGRLVAYPFESLETAGLAADLKPEDAAFYHCFPADSSTLRALRELSGSSLREAAVALAAAVNADVSGRAATHLLVATVADRTAVLTAGSSYRVSANVAALAVEEVLAGRVPDGVARAGALDPRIVIRLPQLPGGIQLTLLSSTSVE